MFSDYEYKLLAGLLVVLVVLYLVKVFYFDSSSGTAVETKSNASDTHTSSTSSGTSGTSGTSSGTSTSSASKYYLSK
jgi:uncharacterized protein YpmB